MSETVLVTGGTGFIGRWAIVELLRRGYGVRTTVRSLDRAHQVRDTVESQADVGELGERLTFAAADLTADAGWDKAMSGCRFVLHVASPLGSENPSNADDLIIPARDGTLRVLRAATRAGVQRVVMTSAANTASPSSYKEDSVTDETLWTNGDDVKLPAYRRSKTLAERAAWTFMETATGPTTLTTILPGAVFGPILATDNLGSVEVIGRMLRGEMPGTPRIGLEVVDVRDLVDAHIRAMTSPAGAGERFLATGEFMWMGDIATVLREQLGAAAAKVPSKILPNALVRSLAMVKPELRGIMPGLGRKNRHSTAKAERVLGWTARPGVETVVECARSLIAHGMA